MSDKRVWVRRDNGSVALMLEVTPESGPCVDEVLVVLTEEEYELLREALA